MERLGPAGFLFLSGTRTLNRIPSARVYYP
jgi:hypothetical protein